MQTLADQVAGRYHLAGVELTTVDTLVNDVFVVRSAQGQFALKVYRRGRSHEAVQWEVELVRHLRDRGAPVVAPVRGRRGDVEHLTVDGVGRVAVLYPWAAGAKPAPSTTTYASLGEAAALIHRAADGFISPAARETYDAEALIDDQLQRMRPFLENAGCWRPTVDLAQRLRQRLDRAGLERGICHLDLTLDNVHVHGAGLTAFDFDSAGVCWRAFEPSGVLRFSEAYFTTWLAAYRGVRPFSAADESAVAAFGIIGDLRVTAWKLGAAESSRGVPLLRGEDLPAVVDGWLEWEAAHLASRHKLHDSEA